MAGMMTTQQVAERLGIGAHVVHLMRKEAGIGQKQSAAATRGPAGQIYYPEMLVSCIEALMKTGLSPVPAARLAAIGQWNGSVLVLRLGDGEVKLPKPLPKRDIINLYSHRPKRLRDEDGDGLISEVARMA